MVAVSRSLSGVEHDPVLGAIDRRVATTTALFHRALASTLATFEEPSAPDPRLALVRLDYLIETLLGVAAAGVISSVVTDVVGNLGSQLAPAIRDQLREALAQITAARSTPRSGALIAALPAFVPDAAARPLVDELGARLHARIGHASRDHHQLIAACATAMPAPSLPGFVAALAQLDGDAMLEHLWTEHLRVAWCYYAAAVADRDDAAPVLPPALAGSTACKTWRAWLALIRGERPEATARPPLTHAGEYIMAVM